MKYLSVIGKAILTGVTAIAKIEGLIPPNVNLGGINLSKIEDSISKIANIIIDVEVMGQALSLPGAEKLKAAGPLVAQIILKSSILVNHTIENAQLFAQGCTKIADGFADVLNSLKANK